MKKILIIQGHPRTKSLCGEIASAYEDSAKQMGAQVMMADLSTFDFELNLKEGYKANQPLEPDLKKAQAQITEADHMVFVFPSWWASMPALLKGFLDRVFLPGFAFKYRKDSPFPEKLLKGKTARIFITMDAPAWYYKWFNKAPGLQFLKFGTLEFCGVKPVKYTLFGTVRYASKEKIEKYIQKVKEIALRESK